MTLGGGRTRSRLLIVVGAIGSAGVAVSPRVRQEWWFLAVLGAYLVAVVGFGVAIAVVGSRRRHRPAGFVLTRGGFGVVPTVPPELLVTLLVCLLGVQVQSLVNDWRDVTTSVPALVPTTLAFAGLMSIVVAAVATITVLLVPVAWHGYAVELTPAGIRSRGPFLRRLVPWTALAPGMPRQRPGSARQLLLDVHRPELVVQHGWTAMHGTRQRPILPVDTDARLLAAAIRWYVEHPADRAGIGTEVEYDRLVASLPTHAEPEPAPADTPTGTFPARPRRVRAAVVLVYVTAAVALLTATAELAGTLVFRENLLAAERAIAASQPPNPPDTLIFSTDTWAFARGWAIVSLVATMLVASAAVALAHATYRGSNRARVGLVVASGATTLVAWCPCWVLATGLTADPAAGALLNLWPALRLVESFTVSGLALVVLLLLRNNEEPESPEPADRTD